MSFPNSVGMRLQATIAIIDGAEAFIKNGWVAKAWAATDDGTEVDLYDPRATRWCGEAALTLATKQSMISLADTATERDAAWQVVTDAASELYGGIDLSDVNDHYGRDAMLAVFARARILIEESPDRYLMDDSKVAEQPSRTAGQVIPGLQPLPQQRGHYFAVGEMKLGDPVRKVPAVFAIIAEGVTYREAVRGATGQGAHFNVYQEGQDLARGFGENAATTLMATWRLQSDPR